MKEQKKKEETVEWDKKKIFLFLFSVLFLIAALYEVKTMFLGQNTKPAKSSLEKTGVKGADTRKIPFQSSNIKQNIQNEINNLKEEAQNINLVEIASSSPQVQKVINDLKALQNYPSSQIKQACEKVCSGL